MISVRNGLIVMAAVLALAGPAAAAPPKCSSDAVAVGPTCVDKYEESLWQIPPTNLALIKHVLAGNVTLAQLTAGGATQLSYQNTLEICQPPIPATFPQNGNWTAPVYAVSIAGVLPSGCVSWPQAEQACALVGKRLLTNQEWQRAAAGTPDPGATPGPLDCNTNSPVASNTGSRTACVSRWGVFDMVGNVFEWVGDWGDRASGCQHWGPDFGNDFTCAGGSGSGINANLPGTVYRGGSFGDGDDAGVFYYNAAPSPTNQALSIGFRCGR
jgi:formylglycine-generating enzyme required for sulfatase activity